MKTTDETSLKNIQLFLFENAHTLEASQDVITHLNSSKEILEIIKWQEFHDNGQLWIDGAIAIVNESVKDKYDYRHGWYDCRGCNDLSKGKYLIPQETPVCRVGIWTKYYDNGQMAWKIDYANGLLKSDIKKQKFDAFRKDGSKIITYD